MSIELRIGDCLELMNDIPSGSVDLILTDPPYGTTACKWDSVIPFEPMWAELKRVIKPAGAIVLHGSQPFTSALIMSNPKMFKYEWIWEKSAATGHLNAKKRPMRKHEDILVFYSKPPIYNPQGVKPFNKIVKKGGNGGCYGASGNEFLQEVTNYPRTILKFKKDPSKIHPTQKPVALLEYLIKTYTYPYDTVLDFTMGSGSTGVAAKNLDRYFIGIEKDPQYFEIAQKRIQDAD